MKQLKFAYLSSQDPRNKRVWSGTHFSIYKALKEIGEVDILGPYEPKLRLFFARLLNQIFLRIFNKRISYRHSLFISKGYASYFNKKINEKNYDYIVAPAASCELAFIKTKIPVIYITDGTFSSCLNYHKSLTNLTNRSVREGNVIEKNAINNSDYVVVSSDWCASSVTKDYNCPSDKIYNFPYGANFEHSPQLSDINFNKPEVWKLIFVGVYWEDKGGEYAFNCFKILADKGYNVELTILGCKPPEHIKHHKLNIIPFIDKNSAEGQSKIFKIYQEHHILILPTRFDCTPIVINEASSFGIPCIVSKTGGVEGHLKNGVNGFLIDYNDDGKRYAVEIEKLILSPEKYIELRKSTRALYEEKLNWESWKKELKKLLNIKS